MAESRLDRLEALATAAKERWKVPVPSHSGAYKPSPEQTEFRANCKPETVLALVTAARAAQGFIEQLTDTTDARTALIDSLAVFQDEA